MNVSEIIARVTRSFGDESGAQITPADIIRWVNDAQRKITNNTDLLQVIKVTDAIVGQSEYTIPPDISKVKEIRLNGLRLKSLSLVEADEYIYMYDNPNSSNSGTPQAYWLFGTSFFLYPTPDTPYTNGLKLYCTRFPIDIVNTTDTPELNQAYHGTIVDYVIQQAMEMDENYQGAQVKAQQVKTGMMDLANDENYTESSTYQIINVLPEDA